MEIEELDLSTTTHDGRHASKRRTYDLIPTDKFWKQQKGKLVIDIDSISPHSHICSPFPTVAEAIQEELERYRQSEDEVKRLKTAMVCVIFFRMQLHSFPLGYQRRCRRFSYKHVK